jgi:hypothetical protein
VSWYNVGQSHMFIYTHILLLLISLNIGVHLINIYDTSSNNNVDIKFSAHDASLEQPLSGTLKIGI